MSGEIEKIEVAKSNGRFYYTGVLTKDVDPEWVVIETTRGETLKYRKNKSCKEVSLNNIQKKSKIVS